MHDLTPSSSNLKVPQALTPSFPYWKSGSRALILRIRSPVNLDARLLSY